MSRIAEPEYRWSSRLQSPDRQAITAAGRTVSEMVRMLERLELDDTRVEAQAG